MSSKMLIGKRIGVGYLNVHFQNFNGKKNSSFYSISLRRKEEKENKKLLIKEFLDLD
ncbi:NADH-ubiquinone oxidoreductase (complex I), chain 5 carboxy-terminal protein [Medicago truncatula]|uniref:NAD(P)H-quinone oxidoreductase subunit 5, chloroplastic n=1 Tax=Medicago truncatula TaxID=3880 RepID=G7JE22_MEDTR|nr:NADH-ubiquinone oxidoreductase (complex I), chain 5 carboxy-terminal protein [Medicago truncatula]